MTASGKNWKYHPLCLMEGHLIHLWFLEMLYGSLVCVCYPLQVLFLVDHDNICGSAMCFTYSLQVQSTLDLPPLLVLADFGAILKSTALKRNLGKYISIVKWH